MSSGSITLTDMEFRITGSSANVVRRRKLYSVAIRFRVEPVMQLLATRTIGGTVRRKKSGFNTGRCGAGKNRHDYEAWAWKNHIRVSQKLKRQAAA